MHTIHEPDHIHNILIRAEKKDIRNALSDLINEYEARKGGFYLREVAGGYQIRTRPEYREWIKRLIQPKALRLSKAALETLAIIAYKQPIIRSDIEHIRGVNCGGILRMLLERKLIRVLGKKEIPEACIAEICQNFFHGIKRSSPIKDTFIFLQLMQIQI